jgi:hypothetical protein
MIKKGSGVPEIHMVKEERLENKIKDDRSYLKVTLYKHVPTFGADSATCKTLQMTKTGGGVPEIYSWVCVCLCVYVRGWYQISN